MALSGVTFDDERLAFDLGEVTGALGDSITVLPIVVALAALTPVSLPHALVFFGLFQVVWGLAYGLPLSVEPMKALAGLAVAGSLGYGEFVAAGLLAGGLLLVGGATGTLGRLQGYVSEPVVRGIQLAVALLLLRTGVELGVAEPGVAAGAALVAVAVAAAGYRRASALAVLGAGVGLALLGAGVPAPSLPAPSGFAMGSPTFSASALGGTAAQLAMTVGNAVVATALLCSDLFDRRVSPDRLSRSMGVTCLLSVPLGGIPMCHGSGGLAGKHAFGARTGGANVVLGGLYLLAALFAGVVAGFPMAVLGVLLAVVAVHLGRRGFDADRRWLVVGVGVVGVGWNVGAAFLLGVIADAAVRRIE
ncbi:putative sulfate/molybdate transporter [Halorarum salinum]|uniref:Sulfate transporter n=1 Tax=Halorarum salinum TaxID=2743089 RepID=A0A7D5L9H1_9EURY|nr:putative sulfate/molybdate transporter [Halobaculum salinum]QLG61212.1 sulfate transporter [Halobaculum salinum]